MQKDYGERRNYKEIHNALELTIMVLDSSYFTDANLESTYEHDLDILVIPQIITRRINNKLRGKKFQDVKYLIEQEVEKITKRYADITPNGYICPYCIHSEECVEKEINSEFNRNREGKPDVFKEVSFNFEFIYPVDCPLKDI